MMLKRKRNHEAHENPELNSNEYFETHRHQRQLSKSALDQYEKTLFRALRLARGFERQKLGRRQKTAKQANDDAETSRLNAEVAALKALDLPVVARLHLYKSMLKSKPISSAPAFPTYITAQIEAGTRPQDTASSNVQARLFNTSAVKTTLTEIMNGVGLLLGIPDGSAAVGKKVRLRASKKSSGGGNSTNGDSTHEKVTNGGCALREQNESQMSSLTTAHAAHESDNTAFSDDISDDYHKFASRLGNSSDDDSTEEESRMEESSKEGSLHKLKVSRKDSFSSSCSPEPSKSASPQRKKAKIPAAVPKRTTFLPSLTLGGYISDSNSDHSTFSDGGLTAPEPRKNRRGQQARRQIWEKKYGANAKHLQRQAQSQDRDQGWDPRAGARPADDGGKVGRGRGRGKGRERGKERERGKGRDRGPPRRGRAGPLTSGANSDPIKARPTRAGDGKGTQSEGPLHPSWEAAKKAKEAMKSVSFQGKKLVFD